MGTAWRDIWWRLCNLLLQWSVICCLIPGQAWTKTRQGSLQGSMAHVLQKILAGDLSPQCTVLLLPLTNLMIGTKSNSWYWWRDHIAENILGMEISYFISSDAFLAQKICVKNILKIPCLAPLEQVFWFSRLESCKGPLAVSPTIVNCVLNQSACFKTLL